MKAVLCPVCNGSGKVTDPAVCRWKDTTNVQLTPPTIPCHGCEGKGWVEVREDAPSVAVYEGEHFRTFLPR